jgi:hypothetical protein
MCRARFRHARYLPKKVGSRMHQNSERSYANTDTDSDLEKGAGLEWNSGQKLEARTESRNGFIIRFAAL